MRGRSDRGSKRRVITTMLSRIVPMVDFSVRLWLFRRNPYFPDQKQTIETRVFIFYRENPG